MKDFDSVAYLAFEEAMAERFDCAEEYFDFKKCGASGIPNHKTCRIGKAGPATAEEGKASGGKASGGSAGGSKATRKSRGDGGEGDKEMRASRAKRGEKPTTDKQREAARAKEAERGQAAAKSRAQKKAAEPLRKEVQAKEKELKSKEKDLNARSKKLKEMQDVAKSGPKNPELNARIKAYSADLRQRERSFNKDMKQLNKMGKDLDVAMGRKKRNIFGL